MSPQSKLVKVLLPKLEAVLDNGKVLFAVGNGFFTAVEVFAHLLQLQFLSTLIPNTNASSILKKKCVSQVPFSP